MKVVLDEIYTFGMKVVLDEIYTFGMKVVLDEIVFYHIRRRLPSRAVWHQLLHGSAHEPGPAAHDLARITVSRRGEDV